MGRNSIVSADKIINAARDLFTRYGYAKTTIEDIAKSLHVGKSSLYYYFKDKETILRAGLDQDIGKIKDRITKAMALVHTPQEKLRIYTIVRMTCFKEFSSVYTAFQDVYLNNHAFIQKIREGYDKFETTLIYEIIKEGITKGIFSIKDIDPASSTIFAVLKGIEFDWARRFDTKTIEKNVDALYQMLLYGIMKR